MTEVRCPECGSTNLVVREVTSFKLNTGEFFCHSIKAHDAEADVGCLDCGKQGERGQWEKLNKGGATC